MKRILLVLIMSIFLVSLVSAEECSIPPVKQGDTIELTTVCRGGCTGVNLTKVMFPNQSMALLGEFPMTENGSNYNYTFSDTNTFGTYFYDTEGIDPNTIVVGQTCSFEVTYNGKSFSTAQSIIYFILFMMLLLVFIIILFGINMLPKSNQQDEGGKILSISYLKYLRPIGWIFEYIFLVAIFYITSNIAFSYLETQLFAKVFFVLFQITFGFAPLIVIVWIIWIYRNMLHDKEFQDLLNRGIFPEGKNF